MDCPSCGLILTTPNPVPAGTLVNCPKCGTCFGVPALEIKTAAPVAPVAQAVAAPTAPPVAPAAVPAATPVAPKATPAVAPKAVPAVARARAKAPRAATNEDSWFPELDTSSPRVRPARTSRKEVEAKTAERPMKKGKRRSENAPLIWSLVVAGVVVVIGSGVALWKFAGNPSDTKAKAAPAAAREGHRTANAQEKADAASPPERKAAAAAPAAEKRNKTAAEKKKATAKKDKTTEKKKDGLNYDDDSDQKLIPGVPTAEPGKKK
jgi:hypothetical protein